MTALRSGGEQCVFVGREILIQQNFCLLGQNHLAIFYKEGDAIIDKGCRSPEKHPALSWKHEPYLLRNVLLHIFGQRP